MLVDEQERLCDAFRAASSWLVSDSRTCFQTSSCTGSLTRLLLTQPSLLLLHLQGPLSIQGMATNQPHGKPATSGEAFSSDDPTRGANDAVSIRPAVEADVDFIGELFAQAFALIMKNIFPSGCNDELVALRRHTMRKLFAETQQPDSRSTIDVAVSRSPQGEEQRLGFIFWRYVGLKGYEEPHPRDDTAVWPSDSDEDMHWRFMDALRQTAQRVAPDEEHIREYSKRILNDIQLAYDRYSTYRCISDIDILCVSPKIARTGAGKRLFGHVHYHALKARRPIYLDAAPTGSAVPFWKSKGFVEIGRTTTKDLEDAIAMWRRLKKSEQYEGEWSDEWARELVAKPAFGEED